MKLSERNLLSAIKKFDEVCFDLILEKEINITYSLLDQDLCRFDNYDQQWDVSSRPHHFHPRKIYEARESPMSGNPLEDMEELCLFLRSIRDKFE
ncbi:MAG: hypothetical protein ACTSVL_10425 [Promethearchaeota archaeon]